MPRGRLAAVPGVGQDSRAPGSRTPAFRATSRWLRGRILDRLRDAGDGTWVTFDQPIGEHAVPAQVAALTSLARDGLVELGREGRTARLPLDRALVAADAGLRFEP